MSHLMAPIASLALFAALASPAAAQPAPQKKETAQRPQGRTDEKAKPKNQGQGNGYGNWQNSWGARPSAPPAHWTRKNDWYRHVRACQVKYRSYDSRTDSYRLKGQAKRCGL